MEAKRGMTPKTIKKIIRAKLEHWAKHVEDEKVRSAIRHKTIMTGGAIASMLLGEEVKDFDVYMNSREAALLVARYYCDQFNELNPNRQNRVGRSGRAYVLDFADKEQVERERAECGPAGHLLCNDPQRVKIVVRSDGVAAESEEILSEPFADVFDVVEQADEVPAEESTEARSDPGTKKSRAPYRPIFLSSNAITLANKVQVVIRFFGSADQIHENYDFAHCTNYYDAESGELVLRQAAMEALLSRQLAYQGSKYPICSIIRTRKFLARGWHINAGQYLKMAFQVSELNLRDLAVLEDQLVGVDSAYFLQLIDALQRKQESDPEFVINVAYLGSIIDRLF